MIQLFGCSARDRGGLTYFYYMDNNGMIMNGQCITQVELLDKDTALLTLKDEGGEQWSVKVSPAVFDDLEQVVDEYKMYNYHGRYKPMMEVLDGSNWDFEMKYADGTKVAADGYVAYPKNGGIAFRTAEAVARKWAALYSEGEQPANINTDGEMTSFRYERHEGGKTKVYYISKNEYFTGLYCRRWGSLEGTNYIEGDSLTLGLLKDLVKLTHLAGFPQTPLDKEDVKRDRWVVEAEFEGGQKIQIVEYIANPPYDYDVFLESKSDEIFNAAEDAIWAKPREQRRDYTITRYSPDGKPQQKINYSGDGRVLNGYDYNDPRKTF